MLSKISRLLNDIFFDSGKHGEDFRSLVIGDFEVIQGCVEMLHSDLPVGLSYSQR